MKPLRLFLFLLASSSVTTAAWPQPAPSSATEMPPVASTACPPGSATRPPSGRTGVPPAHAPRAEAERPPGQRNQDERLLPAEPMKPQRVPPPPAPPPCLNGHR